MKIVLSTSGSGGHTVPVKWIAKALQDEAPNAEIHFIGSKADHTAKVLLELVGHDKFHLISTGKYRRYADDSKLQKLLDFETNSKNITDLFKFVGGLRSAYRMLRKIKPDVVFVKGGAAALPVGLAANYLKIPLVTHDSDTIPGISNKIVGKKAVVNLVGSEQGSYPTYNQDNIKAVGVPISSDIKPVNAEEKAIAKKKLGFKSDMPLIFVSGGSLGATSINKAILSIGDRLKNSGIQILHQTGKDKYKSCVEHNPSWELRPFIDPNIMPTVYAATDLMLARGSATFMHEVASGRIPMIIVPAAQLYDQVSNAKHLSRGGYVKMIDEEHLKDNSGLLYDKIIDLLKDKKQSKALTDKLATLHNPNSANDVAKIIINVVNSQ